MTEAFLSKHFIEGEEEEGAEGPQGSCMALYDFAPDPHPFACLASLQLLGICRSGGIHGNPPAVASAVLASLSTVPSNCERYFGAQEQVEVLAVAASDACLSSTMAGILGDCF